MSKKGGIEVQFNWIFVFIAGALIFTLILGFANRQAKSADQRIAARLVRDLNTVITQSSVSTGKSDVVDLIQDIQLFCDSTPNSCSKSGCASHIEIGSITAKTETITIFSAPSISQGKLLTWTQHWSVPFRVMNFVYLSNPRTKFAFVGNDPLLHQLYEEMPANTAQVSVSTPATTNNYILRLIYLNEDPTLPAGLTHAPDKEITALKIIPLDDSDGSEYG